MDRVIGIVKRLVPERGFGFIRVADTRTEYFFHRSSCTGIGFEELREGQTVSFEIVPSAPRAEHVRAE